MPICDLGCGRKTSRFSALRKDDCGASRIGLSSEKRAEHYA
jgi:hypothetical protein